MESIFKKILDAVDKLNASVGKDYEEIRKCKADIQELRQGQYEDLMRSTYIRDDHRLILSAPEILIGNLDRSGMDYGGSTVIIRGQQIALQGVGTAGTVVTRATNVSTYAEDPGPDGTESVVHPHSSVNVMGRNVAIESNNSTGVFSHRMKSNAGGLSLHSDTSVSVTASYDSKSIKKEVDGTVKSIDSNISTLKSSISSLKSDLTSLNKQIEDLLKSGEKFHETDMTIYANVANITDISEQISLLSETFMAKIADYVSSVAALAEATRRKKALEDQISSANHFPDDNQIKTGANGCIVSISGEAIMLDSKDSFGNPRTTPGNSGIYLNSPNTVISATNSDRRNIPDSTITMQCANINMLTSNLKDEDKEKTEPKDMGFVSEGKVNIISKEFSVRAIDYKANEEKKDPYAAEKLTEKGSIRLQAESIAAAGVNEKGEAVGQIDLNGKYIQMMGANLDPEAGKIKELAKESAVAIISENILAGSTDEKAATKLMQLNAEETLINDKTTLTAKQDKAFIELKGGKLTVGSDENTVSGKTKVGNELSVTGKTTMTDADVKAISISTHFKAPNLEGGAGSGGASKSDSKTEAKLKDLLFKEREQK